jgi:hypothetical protein
VSITYVLVIITCVGDYNIRVGENDIGIGEYNLCVSDLI